MLCQLLLLFLNKNVWLQIKASDTAAFQRGYATVAVYKHTSKHFSLIFIEGKRALLSSVGQI